MRTGEFTQLLGPVVASEVPWWITFIVFVVKRLQGIREAAAYDPEKLTAPKDLWPLHKDDELDTWYEDRRKMKFQDSGMDY